MEEAPLIKARTHALAASKATQVADTTAAVTQHALAAGEFSNAAKEISSIEALRMLKLLEQHHQRLSELLKFPTESADEKPPSLARDGSDASAGGATGRAEQAAAKVPSLMQHRRSRDLTSSIASNLASARGIPSKQRGQGQPLSPSVSNDPASGNLEVLPRRESSRGKMQNMLEQTHKPSWAPPDPSHRPGGRATDAQAAARDQTPPQPGESGYSRFYSQFGDLFNKLSSPLAFAGLPLITEESAAEELSQPEPSPGPSPKRNRLRQPHSTSASTEPDLTKYYSPAALRAISHTGGANDSFYVVPTSGGTVSYANILTFAEKEKRRMEASSLHSGSASIDDEDDFVDAHESPSATPAHPPSQLSPIARRRVGKARSEKELHNTIEELCLENKSLKEILDKVSRRLQVFEASSQKSGLALAESRMLSKPNSPHASIGGMGRGSAGEEALKKVNADLEEKLDNALKRVEVLEKDNHKMQKTLVKYREKWEMLKESAKARRGQTPSGENGGQG